MVLTQDFTKMLELIKTNDDKNIQIAWQLARGQEKELDLLAYFLNRFSSVTSSVAFAEKVYLKHIDNPYGDMIELFSNLDNLQLLSLYPNKDEDGNRMKIDKFPESLCNLPNLFFLNICNNNISDLPDSFVNLVSLERLYMADNKLVKLPQVVCKMTKLEDIILHNNRIEFLPDEIVNLKNLKELMLSENPISGKEKRRISKLLPNTKITY